ncbi:probable transcription factor At5g61620 isoform X2 [Solanum pennellii]|uniref:Probable transcription factor At5g61620 isoform X2 n=1 Tax=Solanum pennellii TaxID=28526 RepID=A0ABM1VDQ4_SOLPN|nr:probable transcription factor At5g61620 isoform X2 [Solanum pennellii]
MKKKHKEKMVSMAKDARKCSHCGHNGHNSRTCNSKGIKLFGVRIDDSNTTNQHRFVDTKMKMGEYESIRRSKSLGNLEHAAAATNYDHNGGVEAGYLSDGPILSIRHRKKGTSWTEEEHRYFLIGLENLGKGDWRGISKRYVPSRTPTQVASHAQKYFIRIASIEKKKRRPSVFDVHLKNPNSHISSKSSSYIPEVSKETSSPLVQLFDTCQIKGQASKGVPSATRERPPLSPSPISRPFGVPNLAHMPYVGVPRNIQGVSSSKVGPTISWIPIVNFHNQSRVHLKNYSQGPPPFAPFVAPPTIGVLPSRPPSQVQSQAGHSTPITNKDGVNISIGAL